MTNEEQLLKLRELLKEHNSVFCGCGHKIGFGDIAWNNGTTSEGTDHCSVEIQCAVCNTEIAYFYSWYPAIDDIDDLLGVMEEDWPENNRSKRK